MSRSILNPSTGCYDPWSGPNGPLFPVTSDFKNAAYSDGSSSKSVTDIWKQKDGAGQWNPASDIVPGVGIQVAAAPVSDGLILNAKVPVLADEYAKILRKSGLVCVLDVAGSVSGDNGAVPRCRINLYITNLPDFTIGWTGGWNGWTFTGEPILVANPDQAYVGDFATYTGEYWGNDGGDLGLPIPHRLAFKLAAGGLGLSVDGGPPILTPPPQNISLTTDIVLAVVAACNIGGSNSTAICEKATLYEGFAYSYDDLAALSSR